MMKIVSFLIFLSLLSTCQTKQIVDEKYLEIYFKHIIDSNQYLEARIGYVKKLKQFVELNLKNNPASKKARKLCLFYLKQASLYLDSKNNKDDKTILIEIKKTLTDLGSSLAINSSTQTKRSPVSWLDKEKIKRTEIANNLIVSPTWDSRIYGRWLKQSVYFVEQYKFFSSTTFEYTKIVRLSRSQNDDLQKNLRIQDRISTIHRGNYLISRENNTLTLIFSEKNIPKKIYKYYIDGRRLRLDLRDEFFKVNDQ